MATKEKLKTKAARVREEARETGKVILRAPALVRAAECVIRFLLGAMLSGAEIFGGYAPFGLGLVAASGSGLDGFCALLGACFGYLSFQGFAEGLRYVAGCILAFSLAFAFFDVKAYRKSWFMPLAAAGMDGITGFVYLSDRGWSPEGLIFFGTELLLCGASAYFYRIAFTPWTEKREEEGLTPRQTVSLLILAGTLLLTLSKITLLGDLSVGRCAAAAAVMATAYKGGIGVGATVGVACGLGMDLAAGGMPFYSMAFALSGVMCGVFHRQGRLAAALAYVLSNALAVLWTWSEGLHLSLLYEVFIASVVFLVLPERALRQVGALVAREPRHDTQERARAYVRARMEATAAAFKSLYESMRSAFHPAAPNDNDAASVFDRAAGRICKRCPLQTACWQRDYVSTFNALNDALPAMLERGRGESGDFPAYFSNRCMKFPEFLSAANEELAALLCRRQFQSRLSENRSAVCRQYAELAGVLNTAAAELGAELVPDPVREKRLRQYLTAQGIDCRLAAYYDQAGHLRLELEGAGLAPLRTEEGTAKLSPPGRGGGPPGPAGAGTERAVDGRGRGGRQKEGRPDRIRRHRGLVQARRRLPLCAPVRRHGLRLPGRAGERPGRPPAGAVSPGGRPAGERPAHPQLRPGPAQRRGRRRLHHHRPAAGGSVHWRGRGVQVRRRPHLCEKGLLRQPHHRHGPPRRPHRRGGGLPRRDPPPVGGRRLCPSGHRRRGRQRIRPVGAGPAGRL